MNKARKLLKTISESKLSSSDIYGDISVLDAEYQKLLKDNCNEVNMYNYKELNSDKPLDFYNKLGSRYPAGAVITDCINKSGIKDAESLVDASLNIKFKESPFFKKLNQLGWSHKGNMYDRHGLNMIDLFVYDMYYGEGYVYIEWGTRELAHDLGLDTTKTLLCDGRIMGDL